MDDIINSLMSLLSDDKAADSAKSEGKVENSADTTKSTTNEGSDDFDIQGILSGLLGGAGDSPSDSGSGGGDGGLDIGMLLGLQGLLGSMSAEDNSTKLLAALKPYLADSRKSKVDRAIKILRIVKMIPSLREAGLIDKFLG